MHKDDTKEYKSPLGCTSTTGSSEYISYGGELHLSNSAQLELLLGLLKRGVPLRTTVRGCSMFPFIRDFDILIIAPLNEAEPCLGGIVAFIRNNTGKLAIHRIIAKKEVGWLMRGDNCPEADGVVVLGQIIGHVTRIERRGRVINFGFKPGIGSYLIAWLSARNLLLPIMTLALKLLKIMRLDGRK